MFHRRATLLAAVAVVSAACTETVDQQPPPQSTVIASFSSPNIPTPNDLALAAANPNATPPLPDGPGKQFLQSLIAQGGFPSDQAPTLTVPLRAATYDAATGRYVDAPKPTVDVATVTPETFALLKLGGGTAVRVDTEPLPADSQVPGELRVVKKADATGSRRLDPGRYVFAVRGGSHGVKTKDGTALTPDAAIALTLENLDLSSKENQPPGGLPPATLALVQNVQKALWQPLEWNTVQTPAGPAWAPAADPSIVPAYQAIDGAFPHKDVVSIATFEIAPKATGTYVLSDAGSGQLPFPSDFLLDPAKPVAGTTDRFYVRTIPSFGAAAAGLATLDGFSTTGMMIAPLSGPVQAGTVTPATVAVFELPAGAAPRRVVGVGAGASPELLVQPPALNADVQGTNVTQTIGLQPAIPVPLPTGILYLPPLKEKSRYLVVVTDGVKDAQNKPLERSTLGKILFDLQGDLFANGQSTVGGIDAATARFLQGIRTAVGAVAPGYKLDGNNVVMGYTVSTQTVTDVSVKLSAAPYDPNGDGNPADNVAFTTVSATAFDPAQVGITAAQQAVLFPDVAQFLDAKFVSVDAINPATGALNPDPTKWTPGQVSALVAVPKCGTPPCAAPLVVWHHGLNGGRLQMLGVANSLASKGFVVVATDAPYHGDRAFCTQNSECVTDAGGDGVCTPDQARAGQGDAVPPGTCTTGHLRLGASLTTEASGNYFISGNFFRIRDGIRQDLLDHAALILAAARPPAATGFPQPQQNALATALAAKGVGVDPTKVYLEGLSLGGINGTEIVATNPRISRAVLTSPGGTLTDIFTNAPAFKDAVDQLFLSLGIDRSKVATDPSVAARYLQTLVVAKWILDPADPINYAQHVETKLASPLTAALGPLASSTTATFGQLSKCDQVVPNRTTVVNGVPLPYGDLLLDLGAIPSTLYESATATNGCVDHGVLLDTFKGASSIGEPVRQDAASFLLNETLPGGTVTLQ